MSVYAVGDIQGCYDQLARLLDQVNFDPTKDTLYSVGDLVNRGPKSLKVLRLLKSLDNQFVGVLGNHDFHLLSMIYGIRSPRANDTLHKILKASDRYELAEWLRTMPLMVKDKKRKLVLCHAGIYPWWGLSEAAQYSAEIQSVLSDEQETIKMLKKIYANTPRKWKKDLGKTQRRRFIINAFTRMRFCGPSGSLNLLESGFSGRRRKNRVPWFEIPNPGLKGYRVVFGHWSALGLYNSANALCLDTGCVWGRHLTMVRLPKKPKPLMLAAKRFVIAPHF